MKKWDIRWTSERSVWAQIPDGIHGPRVPSQLSAFIASSNSESIRTAVPSSTGVLIDFSAHLISAEEFWADVVELIESFDTEGSSLVSAESASAREIQIPVCYDEHLAPDIYEVAKQLNCHKERVIELHTAVSYCVDTVGFTPGFGYLSTLERVLQLPRKDTPRVRVPAGSVGIAEEMTAVYPFQSAGGWHLIGRTPLQLFRPLLDDPALLRVGDLVSFERISLEEYMQYNCSKPWG